MEKTPFQFPLRGLLVTAMWIAGVFAAWGVLTAFDDPEVRFWALIAMIVCAFAAVGNLAGRTELAIKVAILLVASYFVLWLGMLWLYPW